MSCDTGPSPEAREATLRIAHEEGNFIAYGDSFMLQLDLDHQQAVDIAHSRLDKFGKRLGVINVTETRSKGGNRHWYVQLAKPMDRTSRTFWQMALGSDPVREALGMMWIEDGETDECFLIELPDSKRVEVKL